MYIYCLTAPSGKQYVGQTTRDVSLRWREHIDDALDPAKDRCKALNGAIRKYGADSFKVSIVAYCLPWWLDHYELAYMLHFDTLSPAGYNIKLGGSNGTHHPETKAKIRNKLLGKRFSVDTLVRRGRSKKRDKDLPMFVAGWYTQGRLYGVRVCRPGLKERRWSLSKHGGMEACKALAVAYLDGSGFND